MQLVCVCMTTPVRAALPWAPTGVRGSLLASHGPWRGRPSKARQANAQTYHKQGTYYRPSTEPSARTGPESPNSRNVPTPEMTGAARSVRCFSWKSISMTIMMATSNWEACESPSPKTDNRMLPWENAMQFRRAVDAAKHTSLSFLCAVFGLSSEAVTRHKTGGLEILDNPKVGALTRYVNDIQKET